MGTFYSTQCFFFSPSFVIYSSWIPTMYIFVPNEKHKKKSERENLMEKVDDDEFFSLFSWIFSLCFKWMKELWIVSPVSFHWKEQMKNEFVSRVLKITLFEDVLSLLCTWKIKRVREMFQKYRYYNLTRFSIRWTWPDTNNFLTRIWFHDFFSFWFYYVVLFLLHIIPQFTYINMAEQFFTSFIMVLCVPFFVLCCFWWYINCRLHAASKANKPKREQHEQIQRTNIFIHCVMIDDTKIKEWVKNNKNKKLKVKLYYIESTKSISPTQFSVPSHLIFLSVVLNFLFDIYCMCVCVYVFVARGG